MAVARIFHFFVNRLSGGYQDGGRFARYGMGRKSHPGEEKAAMFYPSKIYAGFIFCAILLLSACSPAGPLRIASYPSTPVPRLAQSVGAGGSHGGYFIDLTLMVPDVERAAREAAALAHSYSGYADQHLCPR